MNWIGSVKERIFENKFKVFDLLNIEWMVDVEEVRV